MVNYPRHLESVFAAGESEGKVRLLFGARQTGKSTLLKRIAPPDAIVFNLQERRTRLEFERNPSAFSQTLQADRRDRLLVCVDEIQKVPALLDEVQYLHDLDPRRYDFLLTGSSARRLKTTSSNLLPGRAHVYRLAPLILAERTGTTLGQIFPLPSPNRLPPGFPSVSWEDAMLYGHLPGVALEPEKARARTLQSYVELYLEEEIRREALVRNVGAFQGFLELAALESGHVVNLSNLRRSR